MFEPMHYLSAFDAALSNMVQLQGESNAGLEGAAAATANLKVQYHVGLEGSFGEMQVTPRSLSTRHLSKIISIEGIITTCLLVRPKLTKSVHYVEKKGIFMMREYKDATTSPDYVPTSGGATYPTEDSEGNALVTEYGYCGYRDHQKGKRKFVGLYKMLVY